VCSSISQGNLPACFRNTLCIGVRAVKHLQYTFPEIQLPTLASTTCAACADAIKRLIASAQAWSSCQKQTAIVEQTQEEPAAASGSAKDREQNEEKGQISSMQGSRQLRIRDQLRRRKTQQHMTSVPMMFMASFRPEPVSHMARCHKAVCKSCVQGILEWRSHMIVMHVLQIAA